MTNSSFTAAASLVALFAMVGCGGTAPTAAGPSAKSGCVETAALTNDHVGFENGETVWESSCPTGNFHCTQQETGVVACTPTNKKADIVGSAPLSTPIAGCTEINVLTDDHSGYASGETIWEAKCAQGNMNCAQSPTGVIACAPASQPKPIVGTRKSTHF